MFSENKLIKIVVISALVAFLIGFILSLNYSKITLASVLATKMPQRNFVSNTNILFVGLDNSVEGSRRADTIMLANINPYTKYIGLISIPRDCRIYVEGHGYTKINGAFAYGGINLLRQSIANYLKIPIPYYVELDLAGVASIVDEVGGLKINVEKRMYYVDHAGDLYIDLKPGLQILDGKKAIQYVRFRHDPLGDIGRIKRQQTFIKTLAKKFLDIGVIFRVPRLIHRFSKYVKTNLSSGQIISLSMKMREAYELGHLDMATIPGEDAMIDGVSYILPDWIACQTMVSRIIKGYELLPSALPDIKKPPELKLEIANGNGYNQMAYSAAKKLRSLGYQVIAVGDAGQHNYKQTVLVNWHSQNEDEAYILARKLYLHPNNILRLSNQNRTADFTLILGKDWPIEH